MGDDRHGAVASVGVKFSRQDVAEIVVGSCLMAFPTATTEEVWRLGETLSLVRVLLIAAASLFILSILIYGLHHGAHGQPGDRREFRRRVLSTYGLTLAISAAILFAIDHLEFFPDPVVALKRTILVAFPASFAGTVVDSLK